MPHAPEAKVQTRHPEAGKSMPRIDRARYDAVKQALLRVIPRRAEGVPFKDLPGLVARLLPRRVRATLGSINWHTTTVKLDLEARGLIERVPGVRPQHLRRRR